MGFRGASSSSDSSSESVSYSLDSCVQMYCQISRLRTSRDEGRSLTCFAGAAGPLGLKTGFAAGFSSSLSVSVGFLCQGMVANYTRRTGARVN